MPLRDQFECGYQHRADDMQVELVSGCSHFIVDGVPELLVDRALSFLGGAR